VNCLLCAGSEISHRKTLIRPLLKKEGIYIFFVVVFFLCCTVSPMITPGGGGGGFSGAGVDATGLLLGGFSTSAEDAAQPPLRLPATTQE
jgi:hypothetical protein